MPGMTKMLVDNWQKFADNFKRKMDQKVSCIIPAHNEAKTIVGVVEACLKTEKIGEVIVVNDGSSDKTLDKLQPFAQKIKIINLSENQGKGYAVSMGIEKAKYPFLLFLDADLLNLSPHHLYSLVNPVLENKADVTIGVLVTPFNYYYASWPFSGQRCLRKKDVLKLLKKMKKTKYGLEVFLNERLKNKRTIIIPLIFSQNSHLTKPRKQKDWLYAYIKEIWDIFQQTIAVKSLVYREQVQKEFVKALSLYLKINYLKLKKYLLEE